MRINSIPPKEIYSRYVCSREQMTPISAPSMGTDKVELSQTAKTFSSALKAAKETFAQTDVSRSERIAAIKQQIENNTYSVPAIKVAEKILGE